MKKTSLLLQALLLVFKSNGVWIVALVFLSVAVFVLFLLKGEKKNTITSCLWLEQLLVMLVRTRQNDSLYFYIQLSTADLSLAASASKPTSTKIHK